MANERSSVPILFPPPHSAAYGVTVLDAAGSGEAQHKDAVADVLLNQKYPLRPPSWRNGAWLDMAELVNALADRGFIIDGYRPDVLLVDTSTPVQPFTNESITVNAVSKEHWITVLLWVSHEQHRPYTLTLLCTETAEPLITGHTTTARFALRTVDAFLAGLRFAGTRLQIPAMERYRTLEENLRLVRSGDPLLKNLRLVRLGEDPILEEMAQLWWTLSDSEREMLDQEGSTCWPKPIK